MTFLTNYVLSFLVFFIVTLIGVGQYFCVSNLFDVLAAEEKDPAMKELL